MGASIALRFRRAVHQTIIPMSIANKTHPPTPAITAIVVVSNGPVACTLSLIPVESVTDSPTPPTAEAEAIADCDETPDDTIAVVGNTLEVGIDVESDDDIPDIGGRVTASAELVNGRVVAETVVKATPVVLVARGGPGAIVPTTTVNAVLKVTAARVVVVVVVVGRATH